jgi:tetratricopeptide (TPR) repeat protein
MNPRRTFLPGGILLVASLLVSRVPLLNYLGYEYSAAIALMLPLVPGLFLLRAGGREAVGIAAVCLVVALAVGWFNAFFVKNCSPGEGLAWFALLPGIGMLWVAALSSFCAATFRRRSLWYLAIVAAVMIHPLLLGYFTPRVDSYNFIYGYFPGFTYDEELTVTPTLLLWRGVTLLCALWLIFAGNIAAGRKGMREDRGGGTPGTPGGSPSTLTRGLQLPGPGSPIRAAVFFLLLVGLVSAWYFRTDLGFETTASSLRRSLGSAVETRHFRIYYDSSSIRGDEIRWVAAEHEFRFDQVSRFLGTDTGRVIESYLYPDASAKRRLIGAGNTDIAKPWRGEIHVSMDSWNVTLKHELVHALAAEFGMPVIRANVNVGLVEGLAMAASPSFGNRTLQEYAASMLRFGVVDDPAALIRPAGFAFQASTVSYVLMGAFCEYLIATRGIDAFKRWYGGGSPAGAYGMDADSLIALWREALGKIPVPGSWRAHTDYYFRRGSIFSRECARAVANLNAEGSAALAEKDFGAAGSIFEKALGESWNAGSFVGMVRTLMGAGDYDGVVGMFESGALDPPQRGSIAGYRLLLGDALLAKGKYDEAGKIYRDIHGLDLSPGMNEAVALRLEAAATPDLRKYLAPYLAGTVRDSAALELVSGLESMDNPALLAYVRARLLLSEKDYVGAARESANYFAPFSTPELNGAMNDVAGAAFFRLEDFLTARVFFERTLEYGPGGVLKARVRDRVERCEWFGREWAEMRVSLK